MFSFLSKMGKLLHKPYCRLSFSEYNQIRFVIFILFMVLNLVILKL